MNTTDKIIFHASDTYGNISKYAIEYENTDFPFLFCKVPEHGANMYFNLNVFLDKFELWYIMNNIDSQYMINDINTGKAYSKLEDHIFTFNKLFNIYNLVHDSDIDDDCNDDCDDDEDDENGDMRDSCSYKLLSSREKRNLYISDTAFCHIIVTYLDNGLYLLEEILNLMRNPQFSKYIKPKKMIEFEKYENILMSHKRKLINNINNTEKKIQKIKLESTITKMKNNVSQIEFDKKKEQQKQKLLSQSIEVEKIKHDKKQEQLKHNNNNANKTIKTNDNEVPSYREFLKGISKYVNIIDPKKEKNNDKNKKKNKKQ
ncbi:hypothetical protein BMW23_0966 [Bodo saltans virus]|uniref:Uncharacterized protein n=1 Tax=Bodo saltans virus TaxID=2024608 RepID=A0A2H4UVS1_9VIRU|nr:hypothetical protein QJ851_gp0948 [Bodo saltans virus]ATZ81011.1 hypothetical protein BMW23_0966 [Bodo saltans virus]